MPKNMSARRSLISGLGATVAAVAVGSRSAGAQGQSGGFRAMRHPEDSWLGQRAGKHRIFIDASTPNSASDALLYSNNLYTAHKNAYAGGSDADLGIVVCFRHYATPFAYTDVVWAKYGKVMSGMLNFTDPKTKLAPATNLYNVAGYLPAFPNVTIDAVTKRGAYFAVCDAATRFLSTEMAAPMAMTAEAIYKDLTANLIPNSRLVSAGVMAVTRSQEYGYSLLYAG